MTAEEEGKMFDEFGATMITDFPEMTSPFWNMSRYPKVKRSQRRLMLYLVVWKQ